MASPSINFIATFKFKESLRSWITLYNPWAGRKFNKILKRFEPDVVHFHNVHQYLSFGLLRSAKLFGSKVFLTAHDVMLFHYGKLIEFDQATMGFPYDKELSYHVSAWQQIKRFRYYYNPFRNFIIRRYLKYVDKIFSVSNALKQTLNDNGIENVDVVYNAIDSNLWKPEYENIKKFKNKYHLHDKKVIFVGGRMSGLKGFKQMVLILKEIINNLPNTVLLIAGKENDHTLQLSKLAKELNIEKNVIFTGWLEGEELKSAYHSSDVVCTPSVYFDPCPMINLEAMACRKPIVGTCFGGTKEIVRDNVHGYIVNPFDINVISERITYLLRDTEKRKELGENGYHTVKDNFNLDIRYQKTLEYYKTLSDQ